MGHFWHLKRIIKLSETLWYRFQMAAYSCSIDQNLLLQRNQVKIKNFGQMDENTAKNCHLYAPLSQKLISKSKSYSLNATHEQKTSLAQKRLVQTAIFITFTIRSKRRLNKQYFR